MIAYHNWLIKKDTLQRKWTEYAYLVDDDGFTTDRKKAFYNGIPWEKLVKQKFGVTLFDIDSLVNNNNTEAENGKNKSN